MRNPVHRDRANVARVIESVFTQHALQLLANFFLVLFEGGRIDAVPSRPIQLAPDAMLGRGVGEAIMKTAIGSLHLAAASSRP